MANGWDMKPGDEVLMSDQEHPSGEGPWNLKAKRYGIVVKQYKIPKPVNDPTVILNLINDAITPRTKVLFTSHITTETGLIQPVKEMCDLCSIERDCLDDRWRPCARYDGPQYQKPRLRHVQCESA